MGLSLSGVDSHATSAKDFPAGAGDLDSPLGLGPGTQSHRPSRRRRVDDTVALRSGASHERSACVNKVTEFEVVDTGHHLWLHQRTVDIGQDRGLAIRLGAPEIEDLVDTAVEGSRDVPSPAAVAEEVTAAGGTEL